MNCQEAQELLIDYIDLDLAQALEEEVRNHVASCETCTLAEKELRQMLGDLEAQPAELPDPVLTKQFEQMLSEEQHLLAAGSVKPTSAPLRFWKPALQIAATLALVILAYQFGKYENKQQKDSANISMEKERTKEEEKLMVSLMDHESASKRLLALSYIESHAKPSEDILQALINKLQSDTYINVRLSAAEALSKYADLPYVREALVEAFAKEQNPSMQIEMIQIFVQIEERKAIPAMQRLLQNKTTPNYVVEQVKIGLIKLS